MTIIKSRPGKLNGAWTINSLGRAMFVQSSYNELISLSSGKHVIGGETKSMWITVNNGRDSTIKSMDEYCAATFGDNGGFRWYRRSNENIFYFTKERDMMLFTLRWQNSAQS